MQRVRTFTASLGDSSDIVQKEMFELAGARASEASAGRDGGQKLVLRPEGTAGLVREVVASTFGAASTIGPTAPLRLAYAGPMFRRERPQRGRERQFTQLGIEVFGLGKEVQDGGAYASVQGELEALEAASGFLADIGLQSGSDYQLRINSLGTSACQGAYAEVLREYFNSAAADGGLSGESVARLERGAPLRILDSKHPADAAAVAGAPTLLGSGLLSSAAEARFHALCDGLAAAGIDYVVDETLVRGLDYYTETVFEVVGSATSLGASQATLLAGGRYGELATVMGGPASLPGLGWAAGLERLVLALDETHGSEGWGPGAARPVAVISTSGDAVASATDIARELRVSAHCSSLPVVHDYDGVVKPLSSSAVSKRLRRAAKAGARLVVLVYSPDRIVVRDLDAASQVEVARDGVVAAVAELTAS
ncbi:histidyl-tRNA synthetase [Thecamonas trahens ATCC 50062]|uniref:histidine--tRNA ligase n=1 Tax=Thecamonas trahens ATCC 50062 TaxID=461836 RepID=A0A0L0DHH5_THETB|nr:histidyl-tRNA synthetase [Thecamonas trahens ATCC 50062]KNC50763.1 histidyl-tRNA synthetase [Thecamonas trahens ATCC 50062]|eukprot:XP_013756725.1 histidyl-tRNA synthetase [Thecamonas trahens ATCC 50062]